MMISGDNFQFGRRRTGYSYYFSRYVHIWGWASWRRAWNNYDVSMKLWPLIRDGDWLMDILDDRNAVNYWTHCFEDTYAGKIDTWDYQWVFACWIQNGLAILPNVNLVSNIGFDKSGTHTKGETIFSRLPSKKVIFPLVHPKYLIRDCESDKYTEQTWFSRSGSLTSLLKSKFKLRMNK